MKTLWTFGDSLTDFFEPKDKIKHHWRHDYINWKGYIPKVYPEIVSEILNYKLMNTAVVGNSNQQIFEEICKMCNNIKDDDLIIVGWTNQERFRLVNKNGNWTNIFAHFRSKNKKETDSLFISETIDSLDSISKETIQQIMFNRSEILYKEELKNWINILNFTFKNKIFHWSWDERLKDSITVIPINKFESIKLETNGDVNDNHWSEYGQKQMSEFILNMIGHNEIKKSFI